MYVTLSTRQAGISYHPGGPCDSCNNVSDVKMTSPALEGGKAYHTILSWCYIFGIRDARYNLLWRDTDAQLHTFHAATCRNVHEQFDSCNKISDVKLTTPALGGGNAYFIIFSGATKIGIRLSISDLKNKKSQKNCKFNTIGMCSIRRTQQCYRVF